MAYARGYNVEITVDEARPLCTLWKNTFPETYEYLENPGPELDENAPPILPTDTPEERRRKEIFKYKSVTLTGRVRARCSYTQASNSSFQSLAADCTKTAMWNMYKAGYIMTNVIHDETISLLPLDPYMTARAAHIEQIMVQSMQQITPDVKVKAEPALMYRWQKSAEPYFADDTLLPWELVPKDNKGKAVKWNTLPDGERRVIKDRLLFLYDEAEKLRSL